ncbi:hypothetical protein BJF78_07320 [Pseudonocardia sp. CNS-139]|nr:hypothetical protein BJF78_07320 [Pseudonocardia sp. CNS-139]
MQYPDQDVPDGDAESVEFGAQPAREDYRRQDRKRVIGELLYKPAPGPSSPALLAAGAAAPPNRRARRTAAGDTGQATAFIYLRVSTREQARSGGGEEGYSIPVQRAAGLKKAEQLNAAVIGTYIDAGESAKTM